MMHVSENMNGHEVTIIDEGFNILGGEKTGLWVKNRFYQVDEEGKVLIPYSSSQTT